MSSRHPTAVISWAHQDEGWTPAQTARRREDVLRLAAELRRMGVDVDVDAYHQGDVDWTRWGGRQIGEVDFVLIVVSRAWSDAWAGTGDSSRNLGAEQEANALRSRLQGEGLGSAVDICRLIMLPGSSDSDLPEELHGVERHRINNFSGTELAEIVRDLTNQPRVIKPPLGEIPLFPPDSDMGASERHVSPGQTPQERSAQATDSEREARLRTTIAALPEPRPEDSTSIPWVRARRDAERELAEIETRSAAPRNSLRSVNWETVTRSDVQAPWSGQWWRRTSSLPTGIMVHLVSLEDRPLSARRRALLAGSLAGTVRDSGVVPALGELSVLSDLSDEDVVIASQTGRWRTPVDPASFGGVRVGPAGEVSLWGALPRDSMGAVLDVDQTTRQVAGLLDLGARILRNLDQLGRVAVAAELTSPATLTNGSTAELGQRSSAQLVGAAIYRPIIVEPDESVPVSDLEFPSASAVAETLTGLLHRQVF